MGPRGPAAPRIGRGKFAKLHHVRPASPAPYTITAS